jgi:hypothetical protein
MADFNPKKLQVFVSSTFDDLKKERQAAVEAILTSGHIPAGMELFTAGDESQMEVIKQWIDESDVYLLILGGRYGSIERVTGKSYIQLEYEYAVSKGKPLFACVINEAALDLRVKAEGRSVLETDNPQKLKEFRTTVLSKISRFWDDTKDIKIIIIEKLSELARRENLIGWVRPSTQSNLPALADEIARLSKENAELRTQIASALKEDLINGLRFDELMALLKRKNLASFVEDNHQTLRGPGMIPDAPEIRELAKLGLFDLTVSGPKISESGRSFFNKLEVFKLKAKDALPPV